MSLMVQNPTTLCVSVQAARSVVILTTATHGEHGDSRSLAL